MYNRIFNLGIEGVGGGIKELQTLYGNFFNFHTCVYIYYIYMLYYILYIYIILYIIYMHICLYAIQNKKFVIKGFLCLY